MKENPKINSTIEELMKTQKPFWRRVAKDLSKPRRRWVEVNTGRLENIVKEGSTVVVPGKVLGSGPINKKITVAAFSFSKAAKQLIEKAGGKTTTIPELLKANPEGKNLIILR